MQYVHIKIKPCYTREKDSAEYVKNIHKSSNITQIIEYAIRWSINLLEFKVHKNLKPNKLVLLRKTNPCTWLRTIHIVGKERILMTLPNLEVVNLIFQIVDLNVWIDKHWLFQAKLLIDDFWLPCDFIIMIALLIESFCVHVKH